MASHLCRLAARLAPARTLADGDSDGARRKAFKRASEQLQSSSLIAVWTDWAWIPGQRTSA